MIREVTTKKGLRCVQSFPATPEFWHLNQRPDYCTVTRNPQGKWWVSVWGATKEEVKRNLRDLSERQDGTHTSSRDDDYTCPVCGEDEDWETGCNHPWHHSH